MLVTFKTSAHGHITMFGDVAKDLLKMMGQSGNVPGALVAEDVAQALQQLEQALNNPSDEPTPPPAPLDDDQDTPAPVALSVRAKPVIDLLKAAVADNESVMWESN